MQSSRRAQRMSRHHKRKAEGALSLVSLMDIFTILVFFLLVNSSTVTQLPSGKSITLPESTADRLPEENLVIMVNEKAILIQGKKVADVSVVSRSKNDTIASLLRELKAQDNNRLIDLSQEDRNKPGEVTIMGDKEIPYKVLKKIMATLGESRFTNISLAVQKKAREAG